MPNEIATTTRRNLADVHADALRVENMNSWSRGYPADQMLDPDFVISRELRAELRKFKIAWLDARQDEGGVDAARLNAIRFLVADLSRHFEMPTPEVGHRGDFASFSGASCYGPGHRITLSGRLSIITTLHEFTHARGYGETGAVWWSVNCFRNVWPRAYERLVAVSGTHVLVRRHDASEPATGLLEGSDGQLALPSPDDGSDGENN